MPSTLDPISKQNMVSLITHRRLLVFIDYASAKEIKARIVP